MAKPRRVKPAASIYAFGNRMGITYYLHEGRTKTGKPRYFFAKTIGDSALGAMPEGFEVSESINGVVSVRRRTPGATAVPAADVTAVEAALARHPHLNGYVARAVGSAVVIFEPHPRPGELRELAQRSGLGLRAEVFMKDRMKHAQYTPVMKFEREGTEYVVLRMTYRGKGGWSWPLQSGKLDNLARKFVPSIGTEAFFELM